MMRFFLLFLLCSTSFIAGAKELGPDVAVYRGQELKWEQGAYGYHVMFKSLLANLSTDNDYDGNIFNPQADACLDQSTYHLDEAKIPADATIVRAFLVWTGAQPIAAIEDFTDDQVRLDFVHESVAEMNIGFDVVGRQSRLTDAQDFEFEAIVESDELGDRGFFTHRVNVTDFFKQIQENGRVNEVSNGDADGLSLLGDYTVSGLDCATDAVYRDNGFMVSSWSLVLIYTSALIVPQNVYMYAGLHSYQHANSLIQINGFEFPDEPKIKLTLNVNGGDTGQVDLEVSTIPESLQIKGENVNYNQLFNSCNYLIQANNAGQPFFYTEIFNEISSEYDFDPTNGEHCIGSIGSEIDPATMEYGIDTDTFYIDAAEVDWAQQFFRGGQHIILNLGVNQDRILSNFIVLSHDVRYGVYDIPPHLNHPENVYEKGYCSCAPEENAVCLDQEFTYFIRVQNWGDDIVQNVKVQDTLSPFVDYVRGTTQIATHIQESEEGQWIGYDWTVIADGPGGEFPLSQPFLVADQMNYCEMGMKECLGDHDRRLLRFKVKPKQGLSKYTIIENTAIIMDDAGTVYPTNSSVPLKLHSGSCLPIVDCESRENEECLAVFPHDHDIINDEDVLPDYDVIPPECMTNGVKVKYAMGPNSPSDNIIVPNPSSALVLGQFSLLGETESGKTACVFQLDEVRVKVERSDTVQLSNFKLVHDLNGNGRYDAGEIVLAMAPALTANYIAFSLSYTSRRFAENTRYYFLIIGDAATEGTVQPNTIFQAVIEGAVSFVISDDGDATAVGAPIAFAQFMFEPDGPSFMVTNVPREQISGLSDEDIQEHFLAHEEVPFWPIQMKAKEVTATVSSVTFAVPADIEGLTSFKKGIRSIALYVDTEGDGEPDGEPIPATVAVLDRNHLQLSGAALSSALTFAAGEEKHFVVAADFAFTQQAGCDGKIGIEENGVVLTASLPVYGLPIRSETVGYSMLSWDSWDDPLGVGCPNENHPSCGCSLVW